jgi:tetratricopeptide (TPR) repeat protein
VVEKIPFFVLVAVVSGLTFWIHKSQADVRSLARFGIGERIDNTLLSYVLYLGKLVWPTKLATIYPYPTSFDQVEVVEAGLLLLAISALCIEQWRRRPYLATGWFWYLGTMVPVIGLVQVGWQAMADRHTYFPLAGPVMGLTWLAAEWAAGGGWRKYAAATAATAALGACIILTRMQLGYWQNTVTLFERTVAVTPGNFIAETDLGAGLESEGRFREAAVHDRVAVALAPFEYQLHYQLGQCLGRAGYIQAALEEFRTSVSDGWRPDDYQQCMAVAEALTALEDYGKANELLEAALKLKPDSVTALNDLAWNLSTCPDESLRDGTRAVTVAERACELTGYKETVIMGTLAAADAEAGRFDEAAQMARKAIANAHSKGERALEQKNRELLQLYLAHQAYHEQRSQK